jgi:DNA ligase (NAD+)
MRRGLTQRFLSAGFLRPLGIFLLALAVIAVAAAAGAAKNRAPTIAPLTAEDTAALAAAIKRCDDLRAEIAHHNQLYFEKAAPEISDAQYDELKRELARLEEKFPDAAKTPSAFATGIGDDHNAGFTTVAHRAPMLSLAKAYSEAELRAFLRKTQDAFASEETSFVIEPKFDGVALSVIYEKGLLTRAITRGNGQVGDDVTANILALPNLPHRLAATSGGQRNPIPDYVEIRGELFIPNAAFARLNREQEAIGETPFAHPRNLAAGTLKQNDPTLLAERGLEVVFYALGAVVPVEVTPASQSDLHDLVRRWGLPGVKEAKRVRHADEVWNAITDFGQRRAKLPFPVDGAVVKLDSLSQQRRLGESDSAPRWAIAYKFPAQRVETTLQAIRLQIGRSGAITPVAELQPVNLAGTTVSRATLYNRSEVTRRDLRVGDTVILEKAGEVVPAIVGVNLQERPATSAAFVFPTVCPECHAELSEAEHQPWRCPNPTCPAQLRRRLEYFAGKDAMNISGLGPATVAALVEKGLVRDIPDLYRLPRSGLLALDRAGEKSTDRLLGAIEASKRGELWRVIAGLGIPRIGAKGARALAQHFGSLQALLETNPDILESRRKELQSVLGSTATDELIAFLGNEKNRALLFDLTRLGVGSRSQ